MTFGIVVSNSSRAETTRREAALHSRLRRKFPAKSGPKQAPLTHASPPALGHHDEPVQLAKVTLYTRTVR